MATAAKDQKPASTKTQCMSGSEVIDEVQDWHHL